MNTPGLRLGSRERTASADLTLTLKYSHGLGDLSPYFEGLGRGLACATRCAQCDQAWFPPRLICPSGHADVAWIELPGTGVIRAVTQGRGRLPFDAHDRRLVLALIAMDGAHNLALGRIDSAGNVQVGDAVRLIPDVAARGGQVWGAVFESIDADSLGMASR